MNAIRELNNDMQNPNCFNKNKRAVNIITLPPQPNQIVYSVKTKTMATGRNHKRIPKASKYKYVTKYECERGVIKWQCDYKCSLRYNTEREAAIAVDLRMIEEGKEPINILVRK